MGEHAAEELKLSDLTRKLKAASTKEQQETVLWQIVGQFPFLFAYWLKLIQISSNPSFVWTQATTACPAIELWVEYLKSPFGNSDEAFHAAEKLHGAHFHAHLLYDIYIGRTGEKVELLKQLVAKPLYKHTAYVQLLLELEPESANFVEKVSQSVTQLIKSRWHFESQIRRPYFHPQVLCKKELEAWSSYLTDVTCNGSAEEIKCLYTRCTIATALYPEFWIRYIQFLIRTKDDDLDHIVKRALEHIPNDPFLKALNRAALEATGKLEVVRKLTGTTSVQDLVALDIRTSSIRGLQQEDYEFEYITQSANLRGRFGNHEV